MENFDQQSPLMRPLLQLQEWEPLQSPLPASCPLSPGFLTSVLLTLGPDIRQGREGYPMHCRMFNSIPDLYPLELAVTTLPPRVVTIKNVSKHCQVSPQRTKSPLLETHCSNCTQCPSACKENGTVSSISLERSQHNNQDSKRKAPAEKETSSSIISCVSSI